MKLPTWLRMIGRPRRRGHQGAVTVTIVADVSQFVASMQRAADRAAKFQRGLDRLGEAAAQAVHDLCFKIELWTIGLEARYYVRGGADYLYADPAARDAYVKEILRIPVAGPRAAAAFISGWCDTYGKGDREPYVCHRLLGDTPIEVAVP